MIKKILKIKFITGILIIILIALLQLTTAYFFGFKTEKILDTQIKKISTSPYITISDYKYSKGMFSSDITATISLNNKLINNLLKVAPNIEESTLLQNTYSIKYHTHISQGILSGLFNGEFVPTLAITQTDIIYPEPLENILKKFFTNKTPILITNIIYLDGNGKIIISSPSFDYEEALSKVKITWSGLDLITKYNQTFDSFTNKLDIPAFTFNAPAYGSASIKQLAYNSKTNLSVNQIKVGDTNLKLKQVQVKFDNFDKPKLMLGDLLNSFTGINSADFLNELDVINPTNFNLSKLTYNSNSTDINGYFNANAKITFESLISESNTYGPLRINSGVNHVLSVPFSKMIDELTYISTQNNLSNKDKFVAILKKYFATILVDKPVISINEFYLNTPSGEIKLNGNITTNNFKPNDINNEKQFFNKLDAKVSFSMPKNTVTYLFMLQMKFLLNTGNTAMDKQSVKALNKVVGILLDNQLISWKRKGYIKEDKDILSSNLTYTNGILTMKP